MIRTLNGQVIGVNPPQVIVEINGIGYGVYVPLDSFDRLKIGENSFFYIHHHLGEQASDLYGFLDTEQRDFFELLLTVSGVGPKSALAITGSNSVGVLRSAISEGDPAVFRNASGVGTKIAERIIVDLKSKIGLQPGLATGYGEAYEALRGLGYSGPEIKKALNEVPKDLKDTQEQIKAVLKQLARK